MTRHELPSMIAVANTLRRRLASRSDRKDFMSNLVKKLENGEVQREEMTAHASTLVYDLRVLYPSNGCMLTNLTPGPRIAGGETTSTFLGAVTYYLLKHPSAYTELQKEIRSAFKSYQDINALAAQQLPYLQAVIAEGLRIYPPGSQGFPRVSPGSYISGYWVPEGVSHLPESWPVRITIC